MIIFWSFLVAAIQSCKSRPSGVLSIDEMKVLLLHQSMAEDFLSSYVSRDTSFKLDSMQSEVYRKILAFHKIDSATFYKSLEYYTSDIDRLRVLLDSSYAYANREREKRYAVPEPTSDSLTVDSTVSPTADSISGGDNN